MKKYKIISTLIIGVIGLVSFGYCGTLTLEGSVDKPNLVAGSELFHLTYRNSGGTKGSFNIVCRFPSHNGSSVQMDVILSSDGNTYNGSYKFWNYFNVNSSSSTSYFDLVVKNNVATSSTYNFTYSCVITSSLIPETSCPECPTCEEQYTSEECQQEYSLMPISSCNAEYCETNELCEEGQINTGDITRSPIYINGIQHIGAPIFKVTIPEEIQRDSNIDNDEFNLDIVGYGYDQDKMQQMVNTQHYTPTPQEMSNLIGKIGDFLPLIAVVLLVIRTRRCIKKVFKF